MNTIKTKMIRLDDITVPADRMRQLRPEKVDEFAESIAAPGLMGHSKGVDPEQCGRCWPEFDRRCANIPASPTPAPQELTAEEELAHA